MAITLVNSSGYVTGIRQDEVGITIESFKCDVEPEFMRDRKDKSGSQIGFAQGAMLLAISIVGDMNTALTGIMASTLGAAMTIANATAYFGAPTTSRYLMKGSVEETREGWIKATIEAKSWAGIP